MTERDNHPEGRDDAFDDYLRGGSAVSQHYREIAGEEPPTELDQRVVAQARTAARRRRWMRGSAPLAVAASALIVRAIVMVPEVQEQAAVAPAPRPQTAPVEPRMISEDVAPAVEESAAAPAPAAQRAREQIMEAPQKTEPQTQRQEAPQDAVALMVPKSEAMKRERAVTQTTSTRPLAASAVENAARAARMSTDDASEEADLESPERWLARIRDLREAGKIEEAEAELARFREAYPTWSEEVSAPLDEH